MKQVKRLTCWLFNIASSIRRISDSQLLKAMREMEQQALFENCPPSEFAAIFNDDGVFDKVFRFTHEVR